MDDKAAISLLKQGNVDGLETLVQRYQVKAVHAAYMIIFDRDAAKDVAQTAFIKAAERIHQFDETRSFAPWFFRIVVNDALKLTQRQKKKVLLEDSLDEPTLQLAKQLADPGLSPEQIVEQKETSKIILDAIHCLPPGQRSVIVMRYYLDMNMAEMSEETGRPLSTIKWWLRDARNRLRILKSTLQGGKE